MAKINYAKQEALSQERLKELLEYDPETGIFNWKWNKQASKIGMPTGTPNDVGYIHITLNGISYKAHRLAYLYMTGEWPEFFVDHIDGIAGNNKWENLRPVTSQQNSMNQKFHREKVLI